VVSREFLPPARPDLLLGLHSPMYSCGDHDSDRELGLGMSTDPLTSSASIPSARAMLLVKRLSMPCGSISGTCPKTHPR